MTNPRDSGGPEGGMFLTADPFEVRSLHRPRCGQTVRTCLPPPRILLRRGLRFRTTVVEPSARLTKSAPHDPRRRQLSHSANFTSLAMFEAWRLRRCRPKSGPVKRCSATGAESYARLVLRSSGRSRESSYWSEFHRRNTQYDSASWKDRLGYRDDSCRLL